MDLTKKYMENQGTLGYLHKVERAYPHKILAYNTEGTVPEYFYCEEEKVKGILEHWGMTGELVMERYDFPTNQHKRDVAHPTRVVVLNPEETFFRKMYPPEHQE